MSSCRNCKKSPPEVTLKHCAKCGNANYCSRECQKADWKSHKKICGKQTGGDNSSSSPLSPPKGLDCGVPNPFTRLDNGTWLHDRSEKDVFRLLIDAYRLRVEDRYTIEGEAENDSLYSGMPDGRAGFTRFLGDIERRNKKLLPGWWSQGKKTACVKFGMPGGEGGDWHNLGATAEKTDIIEHYGDSKLPMQLRMFVEAVYGRGPGGSNGTAMRKMMAAMEGSGDSPFSASMLDMVSGNVSSITP